MTDNSAIKSDAKNTGLSDLTQQLHSKWAELPSRDQFALILLLLFLLAVGGGYGGYAVHQAASSQKENYQATVNDYFWLRAQAANIGADSNQDQNTSLDQTVAQVLSQMGAVDTQVMTVGDSVQLSFNHNNQTAASNTIGAIINSGITLKQLVMQQNPNDQSIRVQATVSR